MKCRHCNVEMVEGIAMKTTYKPGADDFVSQRGQTMVPAEGELIKAVKCPVCGHSVSDTKGDPNVSR